MASIAMTAMAQEAEYTLLRYSFTHNADGSFDVQYRKELKLLRSRAFTAYTIQDGQGESFILYNPAFMKLTINEAYTLLPNGTKVQTPKNAFVDQLPSFCEKCGRYNGIREMVVVHTALEVDATIVLDYTLHITNKSGYFHDLVDLREPYPIRRLEIHNFEGKDTLLTNVAPNPYESNYEKPYSDYYSVTYGTRPVWPVEKSVPAAADLLKQLKKDNALEYAEAIRAWIMESINTTEIPDGMLFDNQITPAAEVFASGCGSTFDKTGLLCALLNQAGFEAQWTIRDGKTVPPLVVKIDGMEYWMIAYDGFETKPQAAARDAEGYSEENIDKKLEWNPEPLAEGFARMVLPMEYQQVRSDLMKYINTTSRTSEMRVSPCDANFHYTMELPKGARLMGGDVNLQEQVEGIGEVKVNITQKKRNVEVSIHIQITTSKIQPAMYDKFRKMISQLAGVEYLVFDL